ncbi:hypothetical protein RJ55_05529 [Drechmeria coniospora]|nr:hypothetical protein RJ55_05529 [Drechmeria coniospora]
MEHEYGYGWGFGSRATSFERNEAVQDGWCGGDESSQGTVDAPPLPPSSIPQLARGSRPSRSGSRISRRLLDPQAAT